MKSKPIIYCCVPRGVFLNKLIVRPGLIFMSLVFGSFGLLPSVFILLSSDFFDIKSFNGFVNCIDRVVTIIVTIAFFYSAYITYKRRYKPFKYLLYIFWTSIFFDTVNVVLDIKHAIGVPSHQHNVRIDFPYNATENNQLTEEQHYKVAEAVTQGVHIVMPIVIIFFTVFALLNKIYFIKKMKSYVDYVTYKKEAARSVPAVELPHKLPECSQ